jgi:2'-5' RNA ligase
MLTIGTFLSEDILKRLKKINQPLNSSIRWTKTEELHLAWQSFYKEGSSADFKTLKTKLESLSYEFAPILMQFDSVRIMPNVVNPTTLIWDAEIIEIRNKRDPKTVGLFFEEVKNAFKNICNLPPSIQFSPHIVLGRFPKGTKYEDIEKLKDYPLPKIKYGIVEFQLIEASKLPKGMTYSQVDS